MTPNLQKVIKTFSIYTAIFIGLIHTAVAKENTDFQFDSSKPIEVTADSLVVSDNKKTGEFIGNVQVLQGTYRLVADHILIDYTNNNDKATESQSVKNMTATGNVYLFNDAKQAAKSDKMIYNLETKILVLQGNVLLNYNQNTLKGNEVTVNTQTKDINVTGTKKQRVNAILIIPEDKK